MGSRTRLLAGRAGQERKNLRNADLVGFALSAETIKNNDLIFPANRLGN
jgi:hypothetical protein